MTYWHTPRNVPEDDHMPAADRRSHYMPDFANAIIEPPEGYTTCTSCGRILEAAHANTSGRCVDCAGKTKDQLEEAREQPAGNEMAAGGSVLVEPDQTETTTPPLPASDKRRTRGHR